MDNLVRTAAKSLNHDRLFLTKNITSMKEYSNLCNKVFGESTHDYHVADNVDAPAPNPYPGGSLEACLYHKNWIDAVQWHLEDLVRDPQIDPAEALAIKRRIDRSNQERTDIVEELDEYFRNVFRYVTPLPDATLNTESPAWAIDRLSILALKIWHMEQEARRDGAPAAQRQRCQAKLDVLLEQREDLSAAIDQLFADIASGRKRMKAYKQMKMYNDPALNPVLYGKKGNKQT